MSLSLSIHIYIYIYTHYYSDCKDRWVTVSLAAPAEVVILEEEQSKMDKLASDKASGEPRGIGAAPRTENLSTSGLRLGQTSCYSGVEFPGA